MTRMEITSDNLSAVKLWAKKLTLEVRDFTPIAPLIGENEDAIIHLKTATQKGKGDRITFDLLGLLDKDGVTEGEKLEGQEEIAQIYTDSLVINQLRTAVAVPADGTIDEQRASFNMQEKANKMLRNWFSRRLSIAAHLHWAGYTGDEVTIEGKKYKLSGVHYGFNKPTAPTKKRHLIANNKSSENELSEQDRFSLKHIDEAIMLAKTSNPTMQPVTINGDKVFVMYLHPAQVKDLRSNCDGGQWLDIQKSAYAGSRSKNPIFDGSLGMYNGVILREAVHVMPGLNNERKMKLNTRRAVLLGAQSLAVAFGRNMDHSYFKIIKETKDYENELGFACSTLFGIKKTKFNNEDYGTIVVSTYSDL
ncbi:N4-gp56 family major capsid protein [Bartonella sp. DGB1]|uniref:N4-gp56 family major capsid protein n=1 Tax=Bartonella sp. DGB1 TaxID=3239807 RepID=UPI0035268106